MERLVATMQIFRYSHFRAYDPTVTLSETMEDDVKLSYKAACLRHWRRMAESTRSPSCQTWSSQSANGLQKEHPGLENVELPKRGQTQSTSSPNVTQINDEVEQQGEDNANQQSDSNNNPDQDTKEQEGKDVD